MRLIMQVVRWTIGGKTNLKVFTPCNDYLYTHQRLNITTLLSQKP